MCFNTNRSHLLYHRRNPCSTAFPYIDTGLSSALYPTCHFQELNMSILLHLEKMKNEKKKHRGNSWRGVLFFLHCSFFLSCTVITGASGLHIYKSFIGELMHCTWRESAHSGCNYSGWRYSQVLHGKSLSVFLLDCT